LARGQSFLSEDGFKASKARIDKNATNVAKESQHTDLINLISNTTYMDTVMDKKILSY